MLMQLTAKIRSWFSPEKATVRLWSERQLPLSRMLTLHAMTNASGRRFRMVCDRLGPAYLHFQSSRRLALGQALTVEVLLSPDERIVLAGFVKSLDEEGRPCAGQLALNADGATRDLLERYAERHRDRVVRVA